MQPWMAIGNPLSTLLTVSLLLAASTAPVSNVESDVATYVVPDGQMMVLDPTRQMRLFLQARYEHNRVAGAAGSTVPVVVPVNTDGRRIMQSTRTPRAFPTQFHPDVTAYTRIGQGAWTPANVTAVNWATGDVTVDCPNNAGSVRVYYTFGDGEISLRAGRPFGSSTGSVQIFRASARGLLEADQTDQDSAMRVAKAPLPVPGGFTFSIAVRAASAVYFDGLAKHEVSIPVTNTAIQVLDGTALAELAERQLRGG